VKRIAGYIMLSAGGLLALYIVANLQEDINRGRFPLPAICISVLLLYFGIKRVREKSAE
jgi:hypothetical protein